MAEKVLIMGESGTGKSTSLRNCDPAVTAVVNPVGKPLPFKGSKKFTTLNGVTDADEICDFMKAQVKQGKKIIVIDDFQYILAVPYMSRIKETGWDKYNDFGSNYFNIIDVCNELPEDVCVYYLTHCETLESGVTTVKLIGKLLREKITVEGLFTIVLRTGVSEGKYYFFTQNNGKDTVKSPMGMFDSFSIENDLTYVDAKIRNYYEFDDAVSDEQMAKLDEEKAGDVEKTEGRRRHRGSEKSRDEVIEDNNKKIAEYVQEQAKAVEESAVDDSDEVPFEEVKRTDAPALDPVPRRKVSEVAAEADDKADINKSIEEAGEPRRRTRKTRE